MRAELYRGDWVAIARSGIFDGPAENYDFYFFTLTAPSFGAKHRVPNVAKGQTPVKKMCSCGVQHGAADAGLLGVAVDSRTYDYVGQAAWNRHNGILLTNTILRLRERWNELACFVVHEVQACGELLTHALICVPRRFAPSPAVLFEAARSTVGSSKTSGALLTLGQVAGDCQMISATADGAKNIGYISKALNYVLKVVAVAALDERSGRAAANRRLARLACCRRYGSCRRSFPRRELLGV